MHLRDEITYEKSETMVKINDDRRYTQERCNRQRARNEPSDRRA
jgi:hypothetical protein